MNSFGFLSIGLVVSLLALRCAGEANAAVYIVDQKHAAARDTNAGTLERPLKTISRAADIARPGDTVRIRPGLYSESVVVAPSGTREQPIRFEAAESGTVVITGAESLSGWVREPGDKPLYTVPWKHSFRLGTNKDGTPVRSHMAKPPIGCAEQVIWDGRPLRQVMTKEEVQPGTFFVDWEGQRLTVWLPGDRDPNKTEVLGSVRGQLFGPAPADKEEKKGQYITLKGLRFRYAANFAQRGAVKTATGWRIEDCIIEWMNAAGLSVTGSDIVLLRTVVQDNGQLGMGGVCKNVLIQECTLRRNNRKGFGPSGEAGGCKFVRSDGVRVVRCASYENTGPGWWFDWNNTNFEITGCTIYGNHGLRNDWEGAGIFLECNQGPARVHNNTVYSNTGAGIALAENQNTIIENNVLVDNGIGVEFRDMEGRENHKLANNILRNNRIKDWRQQAVKTSLGKWSLTSPMDKALTLDDNVYDSRAKKTWFGWGGREFASLADVRQALGLEQRGRVQAVSFSPALVASRTRSVQAAQTIEAALAGAKVGDTMVIPVNGRTTITKSGEGWICQVFDLANRYITIRLPDSRIKAAVQDTVVAYPETIPVFLRVRLTNRAANGVEAIASGVVTENSAGASAVPR